MKLFESIDSYFDKKSKKDFVYLIVLLVLVIGFLFYYYIYPQVEDYKIREEKTFNTLSSQLQNLKIRMNTLNGSIALLSKKIKEKQNKLLIFKKKRVFYSELVNLLDFAEFDQYKWANIVKSTVEDAKNKGMVVKSLSNKVYKVNISTGKDMPNIVKRMDIGISLEGKYKNFIYYLYSYENRKELIRVKTMDIKAPGIFKIVFSVYGYNK